MKYIQLSLPFYTEGNLNNHTAESGNDEIQI